MTAPPPTEPAAASLLSQLISVVIALVIAAGLALWLTRQDTGSATDTAAPPGVPAAHPPGRSAALRPVTDTAPASGLAAIHLPASATATEPPLPAARAGSAHLPPHPSQSIGTPQDGHLDNAVDLAAQPPLPTLRILPATRRRGFTHATAELITLLRDTAQALARAHPGSRLTVGNLASAGGGDIPQSVSHNSGRDGDLALFAIDRDGRSVELAHYVRFDGTGSAAAPEQALGRLRFDVARTWLVVRQLLSHPAVIVQWIFIAAPLRNMLLDHALRVGEPELLRERARRVLVQPSDSSPHADHLHVRIACAPDDKPACIDGGGHTAGARAAQIDALLRMYHQGSPDERRYARDMLSLPVDGADMLLPPLEGQDEDVDPSFEGGAEESKN